MARRRGGTEALNPWPGYVDALSTLLMVIIFVLLVFVLAQAFLSVALTGRTEDLQRLNRQMDELSSLLMSERGHSADLGDQLTTLGTERDTLTTTLRDARAAEARALSERDQTRLARDALSAQVSRAQAQIEAADAREAALRTQLSGAGLKVDQTAQALATTNAALAAARRDLDAMTRQKAEVDQTVTADRATIQARLSDLAAAATELDRTRALLDAMRHERDTLDTTMTADRATIRARLSDLATAATDFSRTRSELDAMKRERDALDTTVQADRATIAARLSDVAAAETELARARENLDAMKRERDALDTAATADRATIAARQSDLQAAATALAQAGEKLDAMTRERDALTTAVQADRSTIAARQSDIQAAATELSRTRSDVDALKRERDALNATVQTNRATIAARESDLAAAAAELNRTGEKLATITRERDRLDQTVLADQTVINARQSDVARLSQQADAAKAQSAAALAALETKLATVERALELSEGSAQAKDVQIAGLNDRLNTALAQKVEELQRYRSDFFGRLRSVMADRPGITVVGDRFVFQSEVLFPVGSADLSAPGRDQLATLAHTLIDLSKSIPADVPWVLRVDGHADRQPLDPGSPFADNLGLSAQRAINVVKLLAADGVPANRLAATAFGDTQPLDPADTQDAYARNRRIEIRLTDR